LDNKSGVAHPAAVVAVSRPRRGASLTAPLKEALKLQRPLPDDALRMVATVDKADEWVPAVAAV
jgi:hypothetical protein